MDNKTMLRGLRNIGPTIADRLEAVGLRTAGDLKRIGPAALAESTKTRLCHEAGVERPTRRSTGRGKLRRAG
jgi:TfoX C-terminal domain